MDHVANKASKTTATATCKAKTSLSLAFTEALRRASDGQVHSLEREWRHSQEMENANQH